MPNSESSDSRQERSLVELLQSLRVSDLAPETVTLSRQSTTIRLTFPRSTPASPSRSFDRAAESQHRHTRPTSVPATQTLSALPARQNALSRPQEMPLKTFGPRIPKPSELQPPSDNERVQGYYVITVGQEVGIFYTWADASERVNNVPGNSHQRLSNFSDALELYTRKYEEGAVRVVRLANSRFGHIEAEVPPPSPANSDELWLDLEDLSEQMNATHT